MLPDDPVQANTQDGGAVIECSPQDRLVRDRPIDKVTLSEQCGVGPS